MLDHESSRPLVVISLAVVLTLAPLSTGLLAKGFSPAVSGDHPSEVSPASVEEIKSSVLQANDEKTELSDDLEAIAADDQAPIAQALSAADAALTHETPADPDGRTSFTQLHAELDLARRLLDRTRTDTDDSVTQTLDIADLVLEDRTERTSTENLHLRQAVGWEQANVDTSRDLLTLKDQAPNSFALAVQQAQQANEAQIDRVSSGANAQPGNWESHETPSQAAYAVLKTHDVNPTEHQSTSLRSLDDLDGPAASALTDVLDAYLSLHEATQEAFAGTDIGKLTDHVEGPSDQDERRAILDDAFEIYQDEVNKTMESPSSDRPNAELLNAAALNALEEANELRPDPVHLEDPIDLVPVLQARGHLISTVAQLRSALAASPAGDVDPVAVPPALSINLQDTNDTYTTDFHVQIDAGGDDIYHNNAGGSSILPDDPPPGVSEDPCLIFHLGEPSVATPSAAALVDLEGDDTYGDANQTRDCGANGGGVIGSGFLLDAEGEDAYHAGFVGVNGGGGAAGTGFLLDAEGQEEYLAGGYGANGGASGVFIPTCANSPVAGACASPVIPSAGLLVDGGDADDTYAAGSLGVNGAGSMGHGFLFDGGGENTFHSVWGLASNGGAWGVFSTRACVWVPTAVCTPSIWALASGTLISAGDEPDRYTSGLGYVSTNGASNAGAGFLFDAGTTDDEYRAGLDHPGTFQGVSGANGGALLGAGVLLDPGGTETYVGGSSAINGGAGYDSVALLVDNGDANDTYLASAGSVNGGGSAGERSLPLLFDAGGEDTYDAGGTSTGSFGGVFTGCCGANGGDGFLLDAGSGDDTYLAGRTATNGGSYFGHGLLVDEAGNETYHAGLVAVNGGASGSEATGMLVDGEGDDTYEAEGFGKDFGANGAGRNEGNGFLVDATGNDSYLAGDAGSNGGGFAGGSGHLIDLAGEDRYEAGDEGTNGGGYGYSQALDYGTPSYRVKPVPPPAQGFLFDASGDDNYSAGDEGTNGGGSQGGQGFLYDARGNDGYTAGLLGVNGGATLGTDTCVQEKPYADSCEILPSWVPDWINDYLPADLNHLPIPSRGLLLDAQGTDDYMDRACGGGTDKSLVPKGHVGSQIDNPAGPDALVVGLTPGPPSNASAQPWYLKTQAPILTWEPPCTTSWYPVENYTIYRDGEHIATVDSETFTYRDEGESVADRSAVGTTPTYTVRSVSQEGESDPSNPAPIDIRFCDTPEDDFGYACVEGYNWIDASNGTEIEEWNGSWSTPYKIIEMPFNISWYGEEAENGTGDWSGEEFGEDKVIISPGGNICFHLGNTRANDCEISDEGDGHGLPMTYEGNGSSGLGVRDGVGCYMTHSRNAGDGGSHPPQNNVTYEIFGEPPERVFVVQWYEPPKDYNSDYYGNWTWEGGVSQIHVHEDGTVGCMIKEMHANEWHDRDRWWLPYDDCDGWYEGYHRSWYRTDCPVVAGINNGTGTDGIYYSKEWLGAFPGDKVEELGVRFIPPWAQIEANS